MKSFAVRGNVLLGTHLEPGTVVVENGRISEVHRELLSNGNLPDNVIDAAIVSPGLIDLQVNGALGLEVDEPDAIEAISRWMTQSGVTAWLPTVITSPAERYPTVFSVWNSVDTSVGATPLGLHLEGPFLSVARKGAHRAEWIEAATDAILGFWLEQNGIALVTLAPEREGNLDRIRKLVNRGILVSLGHTNATFDEFEAGVDAGARKATHLFNAMTPMHHRQPGAMVATMVDDRVTAGLIADGIHSHPATLELAYRSKGAEGLALVSDMMAATGNGPGTYTIGRREVTVTETTATLPDGVLAGSVLTMDQAVRNMVVWTSAKAGEALFMASTSAASLLGDQTRGVIEVGARADLTIWTEELQVQQTLQGS